MDSDRWLDELAGLVGPQHVLTDPRLLSWAGRDALTRYRAFGRLDRVARPVLAVVRPADAAQVAEVVRWAVRNRVPVVPRGGGTGVMGAAVPLAPAVVVDLGRLHRVEVSPEDMTATAQGGAPLAAVAAAAEQAGLMFAHDPWSLSMATVGGAIATNGMGYLYGRYGTMADQVLALEVVLPDGTLWRSPFSPAGPAGPGILRLWAGAQGTFGIVTGAVLRLWPAPERRLFGTWRFPTFEAGFRAVQALLRCGVVPAVLDLSDSGPSGPTSGAEPPRSPGAALSGFDAGPGGREPSLLHLGFFGFAEEAAAQLQRARRVMAEHGARNLGEGPAAAYWERRHELAENWRRRVWEPRDLEALDAHGTAFEYLNMALPAGRVLEYRKRALELAERTPGVLAGETGLWGRPEIFSILLFDTAGLDPSGSEDPPLARLSDELVGLCHRLGGTMEAIHGPGLRWLHLLGEEWGPGLELLHRIKRALDPAGILNPGKWGER